MKHTISTILAITILVLLFSFNGYGYAYVSDDADSSADFTKGENVMRDTPIGSEPPMVPLSYRNITFEAPATYSAEGTIPYVVKSPDGSFGLSLEVGDANGCNIKRCKAFCTDMAKTLNISESNFKELKINGFKGASLTGRMGELQVKLAVLYKGNREIRSVMIYYPDREQTAQKILYSFK